MSILTRRYRRAMAKLGLRNPVEDYWERRYAIGGTSGAGSYGPLCRFKADVLNNFVAENNIKSVIEFGCGDGNQLLLANYEKYLGIDLSSTALKLCKKKFSDDVSKTFKTRYKTAMGKFDVSLSLDVIFHLTDDKMFEEYMTTLFLASKHYVIIYSSNCDQSEFFELYGERLPNHVRHRRFMDWIDVNQPEWELWKVIENDFPYDPLRPEGTSFSDFYFFKRHV